MAQDKKIPQPEQKKPEIKAPKKADWSRDTPSSSQDDILDSDLSERNSALDPGYDKAR